MCKTVPTPTQTPKIDIQTTTTEEGNFCENHLNRDIVKTFWFQDSEDQCSRSLTEAVFTDQLRRFTVKQFDKILIQGNKLNISNFCQNNKFLSFPG